MKKIDYLSVDGRLLKTFLTVLDESSVTQTARRMGVRQSTISHALGRLRSLFDDPLFVRSGNALLPTDRAVALKEPVQAALDHLERLTHQRDFDPRIEPMFFVVAANDMQRELIFPRLVRDLADQKIPASFELIPSGHPTTGMMRDARCHLALTPFPPEASDIVQKQIFEGQMMCFYDADIRSPPASWDAYCKAEHIAVRFPDGGTSLRALTGVDTSDMQEAKVSVPNFGGIPAFVKGTRAIATEMDLMKISCLKELDMAPLPVPTDPVKIYLSWHERSTKEPAHMWLRNSVEKIAKDVSASFASGQRVP